MKTNAQPNQLHSYKLAVRLGEWIMRGQRSFCDTQARRSQKKLCTLMSDWCMLTVTFGNPDASGHLDSTPSLLVSAASRAEH